MIKTIAKTVFAGLFGIEILLLYVIGLLIPEIAFNSPLSLPKEGAMILAWTVAIIGLVLFMTSIVILVYSWPEKMSFSYRAMGFTGLSGAILSSWVRTSLILGKQVEALLTAGGISFALGFLCLCIWAMSKEKIKE